MVLSLVLFHYTVLYLVNLVMYDTWSEFKLELTRDER